MSFVLVITEGPAAGSIYVLDSFGPKLLGRARDVELILPDSDTSVSRYHAVIEVGSKGVSVRDMQGQGRTRINGVVVNSGLLTINDVLTVGATNLVLHDAAGFTASSTSGKASTDDAGPFDATIPPGALETVPARSWPLGSLVPLRCTRCNARGPLPPEVLLAKASWLCRSCVDARRDRKPSDPSHIGRYEVLRFLSSGGMGRVYEAVAVDTGMHVAVKVLTGNVSLDAAIAQRFAREQRIARGMRHPNVVHCYDVGISSGQLFLTTEFMVGGDSLSLARVDSELHVVLSVGAGLFRALAYGHGIGVVHRDVKPQNLLLGKPDERGAPATRLTDFGLAKSARDAGIRRITARGEGGGSLLMMAPEQLLAFADADPTCDVFSGAALVYRLLTGGTHLVLPRPMQDATMHEVAAAITSRRRIPIHKYRDDVPEVVGEILDGLVARDPSLRAHMNATQVADILENAANQLRDG